MNTGLILTFVGVPLAAAAAARSTWSPCGLSMLSSITPFSERGRGHRYPATAGWFVAGATAGGATLGAAAAGLAAGSAALGAGAHPGPVVAAAAVSALAGGTLDAGFGGEILPVIRRQVDDRWLSRYRPWVYGAGFGWQIGVGVATYVMTFAVFVLVAVAALSADPLAAFLLCTLFGFTRGLAVLLTSRANNPESLRALHRSLERAAEPVRWAAVAAQVAVAVAALGYEWPAAGAGVGLGVAAVVAAVALRRQRRPADLASR